MGYPNGFDLEAERGIEAQAVISKETVVTHSAGTSGHFCGLDHIHLLYAFRPDYRVVLIFVLLHHGLEGPCLMLVICETASA